MVINVRIRYGKGFLELIRDGNKKNYNPAQIIGKFFRLNTWKYLIKNYI